MLLLLLLLFPKLVARVREAGQEAGRTGSRGGGAGLVDDEADKRPSRAPGARPVDPGGRIRATVMCDQRNWRGAREKGGLVCRARRADLGGAGCVCCTSLSSCC